MLRQSAITLLVLLPLIAASAACAFVVPAAGPGPATPAVTAPPATDTPVATPTATPRPAKATPRWTTPTPVEALFRDDFSDPDSGNWNTRTTADYRFEIRDGAFVANIVKREWAAWSTVDGDFDNVAIDVDAAWTAGSKNNEYGLVLRLTTSGGNDEFYCFGLSALGKYSFWLRQDGEWIELIPWTVSPAVGTNKGDVNHLRVTLDGFLYTLFVNGEQVAATYDRTLAHGQAGLYVSSTTNGDTTATFDNFVVTGLP